LVLQRRPPGRRFCFATKHSRHADNAVNHLENLSPPIRDHIMRRTLLIAALPLTLAALSAAPINIAHAQMVTSREGIALENQILALRQQVQQLQTSQSNGNDNGNSALGASQPLSSGTGSAAGANALLPNLLQQVQTLQDQVQNLRGRVDTLEHEVATQHDELKQQIGDLKFQLGQGGATAPGATPPGTTPAPQPAPQPAAQPAQGAGAPQTLGQMPVNQAGRAAARAPVAASIVAARHALAGHDYVTAEADAKAIIAKQGRGADRGAAEYTLGQALTGQRHYQEAALAYDDAYNGARSGPYASQSLLGLAGSLTAIHQYSAACDTLDSLTSQFSSPSPSLAGQVRSLRQRAHCH
jgi:TolA-binding protein